MWAHQQLVEKYLDWDRVERRLLKHGNIGRRFSVEELREHAPPPYHCHYLAWRLGTWPENRGSEACFRLFDALIEKCSRLEGWGESERLGNPGYEVFWSHLWELQVAEALLRTESVDELVWLPKGPDLQVCINGRRCFVECYVYVKSFGAEQFIQDLLQQVDRRFRVEHMRGTPMTIPSNGRETFLDQLFRPLLSSGYVEGLREEASRRGRADVDIPDGACNLEAWLENPCVPRPIDQGNAHPDGMCFVKDVLQKAVMNKAERNALSEHRPNMVCINASLGGDYTVSSNTVLRLHERLPDRAVNDAAKDAVDAFAIFGNAGIDSCLRVSDGDFWYLARDDHPLGRTWRQP